MVAESEEVLKQLGSWAELEGLPDHMTLGRDLNSVREPLDWSHCVMTNTQSELKAGVLRKNGPDGGHSKHKDPPDEMQEAS